MFPYQGEPQRNGQPWMGLQEFILPFIEALMPRTKWERLAESIICCIPCIILEIHTSTNLQQSYYRSRILHKTLHRCNSCLSRLVCHSLPGVWQMEQEALHTKPSSGKPFLGAQRPGSSVMMRLLTPPLPNKNRRPLFNIGRCGGLKRWSPPPCNFHTYYPPLPFKRNKGKNSPGHIFKVTGALDSTSDPRRFFKAACRSGWVTCSLGFPLRCCS